MADAATATAGAPPVAGPGRGTGPHPGSETGSETGPETGSETGQEAAPAAWRPDSAAGSTSTTPSPPGSATAGGGAGPASPFGAASAMFKNVESLWKDLPGLLSDRVELLALELRQAGVALVQGVALVVAAAILGVTAWVAMWAGIVAGVWSLGVPIGWALVVAMLINLAAAAAVLVAIRSRLERLRLPATRRHLTLRPALEPATDEPAHPGPTGDRPLAP